MAPVPQQPIKAPIRISLPSSQKPSSHGALSHILAQRPEDAAQTAGMRTRSSMHSSVPTNT
ncbi:hypothetical protein PGT21_036961 [Puccinia graminis f. sp. tritici]|uniref:Uncharacterized protein n=1 Tax=Puccinia graminis f. sp. tritici TaxID=56615 RepID=A0A5B0QDY9_PUCGR|nr:hypothetical protein PGT21_036961 [Puccinia graminis f. sp. tritici]